MSRPRHSSRQTTRSWLSGLAITVTTLVGLFGFWRLSPGATFVIAAIAFVGLIVALWVAGKEA
ncbi:MAG TPA: hypothetical protein VN034_05945 [Sphingopyxis sp.]|nr:hypothetical protein [Sphingopyxis sp.]